MMAGILTIMARDGRICNLMAIPAKKFSDLVAALALYEKRVHLNALKVLSVTTDDEKYASLISRAFSLSNPARFLDMWHKVVDVITEAKRDSYLHSLLKEGLYDCLMQKKETDGFRSLHSREEAQKNFNALWEQCLPHPDFTDKVQTAFKKLMDFTKSGFFDQMASEYTKVGGERISGRAGIENFHHHLNTLKREGKIGAALWYCLILVFTAIWNLEKARSLQEPHPIKNAAFSTNVPLIQKVMACKSMTKNGLNVSESQNWKGLDSVVRNPREQFLFIDVGLQHEIVAEINALSAKKDVLAAPTFAQFSLSPKAAKPVSDPIKAALSSPKAASPAPTFAEFSPSPKAANPASDPIKAALSSPKAASPASTPMEAAKVHLKDTPPPSTPSVATPPSSIRSSGPSLASASSLPLNTNNVECMSSASKRKRHHQTININPNLNLSSDEEVEIPLTRKRKTDVSETMGTKNRLSAPSISYENPQSDWISGALGSYITESLSHAAGLASGWAGRISQVTGSMSEQAMDVSQKLAPKPPSKKQSTLDSFVRKKEPLPTTLDFAVSTSPKRLSTSHRVSGSTSASFVENRMKFRVSSVTQWDDFEKKVFFYFRQERKVTSDDENSLARLVDRWNELVKDNEVVIPDFKGSFLSGVVTPKTRAQFQTYCKALETKHFQNFCEKRVEGSQNFLLSDWSFSQIVRKKKQIEAICYVYSRDLSIVPSQAILNFAAENRYDGKSPIQYPASVTSRIPKRVQQTLSPSKSRGFVATPATPVPIQGELPVQHPASMSVAPSVSIPHVAIQGKASPVRIPKQGSVAGKKNAPQVCRRCHIEKKKGHNPQFCADGIHSLYTEVKYYASKEEAAALKGKTFMHKIKREDTICYDEKHRKSKPV
ncbi:hypothetical protein BDR26DRAFT_857201 [Obelidium mucronatum]|nr:hypothetical protein BDR26DRAFT_867718 [Obelidium mucronatum]KAI9344570.1 hypothetical protein BDR26DRAFT_857201 [Obelidium mucronatum]